MAEFRDPLRDQEIRRWKEREAKDLEVEHNKGPRPLEGLSSGGHTTWTGEQDDSQRSLHADDNAKAEALSEAQAEGREPDDET